MSGEEQYNSPTVGQIEQVQLIARMRDFVQADPDRSYRLIVGSDSLPGREGHVYLVSAIVLHRVGNGGIYFWRRKLTHKLHTLRDRMYAEALASIGLAQQLEAIPELQPLLRDHIEIHVDVGEDGPTREMIQELVGMIIAHGYAARTKPESFAASKVADRHTIPGPKLAYVPVIQ